jgi:hypothetical protein
MVADPGTSGIWSRIESGRFRRRPAGFRLRKSYGGQDGGRAQICKKRSMRAGSDLQGRAPGWSRICNIGSSGPGSELQRPVLVMHSEDDCSVRG